MAVFQCFRSAFCSSALNFSKLLPSTARGATPLSPILKVPACGIRSLGASKPSSHPRDIPETPSHQETVYDNSEQEDLIRDEIISKVNEQIHNKTHGRLFAVVHLANKQWKLTPEDIIVVEGNWPPTVGDVVRFEKVLLVGSSDFTIVGAPLLQPDLVDMRATVLEKRLSHTRTHFMYKPRKQTKKIKFFRKEQTILRINSIEFGALINQKRDIEGVENRIF